MIIVFSIGHTSTVKKAYYTNDEIIDYMKSDFDSVKISDEYVNSDSKDMYYKVIYFIGTKNYNYMTATLSGRYIMEYSNDVWRTEVQFDNVSTDWSKMLGTWQYVHDNGDYLNFNLENVVVIDSQHVESTYSTSSSEWKWRNVYLNDNKSYSKPSTTEKCYKDGGDYFCGIMVNFPSGISASKVPLGATVYEDGSVSESTALVKIDKDSGGVLIWSDLNGFMAKETKVILNKIE